MKREITTKDLRQFGLVLTGILGLFGLIHFLKGHTSAYPWFWGIAIVVLLSSIVSPRILRPVYNVFIKIAHALGWFNTRLILIVVYYVLLTPIGLIMRVFGKDPLDKKIDKDVDSYWIDRSEIVVTKETLEKQF